MLTTSLGLRTGSFGKSTYFNELGPYELGIDLRFSVFEEQGQDFTKVRVQLIKRFGLRVCPWKSGDESDEKASFRRPFDDGGVGLHAEEASTAATIRAWRPNEVGMPRLTAHVSQLARDFVGDLRGLRHANGTPLVRIYGPHDRSTCGGAVAFNVCDRSGTPLPYSLVETRARRAGVSIRGGCFCNPGASQSAFALDPTRIAACLANLGTKFTPERFAECINTAVGAVRFSRTGWQTVATTSVARLMSWPRFGSDRVPVHAETRRKATPAARAGLS